MSPFLVIHTYSRVENKSHPLNPYNVKEWCGDEEAMDGIQRDETNELLGAYWNICRTIWWDNIIINDVLFGAHSQTQTDGCESKERYEGTSFKERYEDDMMLSMDKDNAGPSSSSSSSPEIYSVGSILLIKNLWRRRVLILVFCRPQSLIQQPTNLPVNAPSRVCPRPPQWVIIKLARSTHTLQPHNILEAATERRATRISLKICRKSDTKLLVGGGDWWWKLCEWGNKNYEVRR